MLRRPPTRIVLKLDDFAEYEHIRREQEAAKEQLKGSKSEYNEPPSFPSGPKTRQEIQARLGYIPPATRSRSTNNNPYF